MDRIEELEKRLGNIIRNTCNTIGCNNCGLSWNEGKDCSATELQGQIMDIQMTEFNKDVDQP